MSSEDGSDAVTLSQLFDQGLRLHGAVLGASEAPSSAAYQQRVKKAILMLEDATRLVSVLDVFSCNEHVSEVATEHLKFLLLPALLGDLQTRVQDEGSDREQVLDVAEAYYRDFLHRCKDYQLCDVHIPPRRQADDATETPRPGPPSAADMARMNDERQAKINRFKLKRELEDRLKELKGVLDHPDCDEDLAREFHLKTLRLFVFTALDELQSFEQERPLLSHMKKVLAGRAPHPKDLKQKPRPLKPVVITKDQVQKEVFGLGYKNLPIYSIEEFYEKRVEEGWFPDPSKTKGKSLMGQTMVDQMAAEEEEARVQEKKEERDDEEELQRKRNWDEYKDDHRRGEGNRHNKG